MGSPHDSPEPARFVICAPFPKSPGNAKLMPSLSGTVAPGKRFWWIMSVGRLKKLPFIKVKRMATADHPSISYMAINYKKMPSFVSPPPSEVKREKPSFTVSAVSSPGIELKASSQDDKIPSPALLEKDKGAPLSGDIKVNSSIIKRTLQNFDILVEMSEVNIGPTVTQYTFKPAEGVKVAKITNLANDLSLALAAHPIRVEAPIPGRSLVGIEIPNKQRAIVRFRDLIESTNFQGSGPSLNLALGRDVAGVSFIADLARMPHLLVAGSTGSGKTICLNSLVLSLLYQNSSNSLKLILVDPKRVEFSIYNKLPHLLTPVIFDAQKTVSALKWLTGEMERRFLNIKLTFFEM